LTRRNRKRARVSSLALAFFVISASLATASAQRSLAPAATPPARNSAPARLVGLYKAHFSSTDAQTAGTWHLRIGPAHHLKVWNRLDSVAGSPSFEAGPVSFRRNRVVFAKTTAEGICSVGATYTWTYANRILRFRLVGRDECGPRVITFTPHPWHRSS